MDLSCTWKRWIWNCLRVRTPNQATAGGRDYSTLTVVSRLMIMTKISRICPLQWLRCVSHNYNWLWRVFVSDWRDSFLERRGSQPPRLSQILKICLMMPRAEKERLHANGTNCVSEIDKFVWRSCEAASTCHGSNLTDVIQPRTPCRHEQSDETSSLKRLRVLELHLIADSQVF